MTKQKYLSHDASQKARLRVSQASVLGGILCAGLLVSIFAFVAFAQTTPFEATQVASVSAVQDDTLSLLDVGTLENATISNVNESYDYTARAYDIAPVIKDANGTTLKKDSDYTLSFFRKSDDGLWLASTDLTSIGSLRLTATGTGEDYYGQISFDFAIVDRKPSVGETVKMEVSVRADDGTLTSTLASFKIKENDEVELYGTGSKHAVSDDISGCLVLPDKPTYGLHTYTLTSISSAAFSKKSSATYSSSSLSAIALNPSLTSIGSNCFSGCNKLRSVEFSSDSHLSSLGSNAFERSGLASIDLPDSITQIGRYCFAKCQSLVSVHFGSGLTNISGMTFSECSVLANVTFPHDCNITSIESYAFMSCTALASIEIPDSVTDVYPLAFSGLKRVTFPQDTTRTTIPDRFLYECTTLEEVELPSTLTSIEEYAFYGCTKLKSVSIPCGVTSLGQYAFSCSTNATSQLAEVYFECDMTKLTLRGKGAPISSASLKKVVFKGNADENAYKVTGSKLDSVSYYFTVQFYGSEADASAGTNMLASAAISDNVCYCEITDKLDTSLLFSGSVPALSAPANCWMFSDDPYSIDKLSTSCRAWPITCNYKDLTQAAFYVDADDYFKVYSEKGQSFAYKLITREGKTLSADTDYTLSYERLGASGVWETTDDTTSPGLIRMHAQGLESAATYGDAYREFKIVAHAVGDTFDSIDEVGNTLRFRVCELKCGTENSRVAVYGASTDATGLIARISNLISLSAEVTDEWGVSYTTVALDNYAFYAAVGITSVKLPDTIESIGFSAFGKCTQLERLEFAGAAADINFAANGGAGYVVFDDCDIARIVYGGKKGTFDKYGSIASENITRYYKVFYYKSEKDYKDGKVWAAPFVKEGAYLTSVGTAQYATSARVPDLQQGFEWVYEEGFSGSEALVDSCYVYAQRVKTDSFTSQVQLEKDGQVSYVPCAFEVQSYDETTNTGTVSVGWTTYEDLRAIDEACAGKLTIPSTVSDSTGRNFTVTSVAPYAFGATSESEACGELTEVVLPDTVQSIGAASFANCSSLTRVDVSSASQLSSIGASAFSYCKALSAIELPFSLNSLGMQAFRGCSSLGSIDIPASVSSIPPMCFRDCSALKHVCVVTKDPHAYVPGATSTACALTKIDANAFSDCTSLESVTFEPNMSSTNIDKEAFSGCSALKCVQFSSAKAHYDESCFGSATLYCAVAFYESEAALSQLNPACIAYIRIGAHPASLTDGDYETDVHVPVLQKDEEWRYTNLSSDGAVCDASYALFYSTVGAVYYQVSFYESDAAYTSGQASSVLDVREGTCLSALTSANVRLGKSVPVAPDGYHWEYSVDGDTGLTQAAYAIARANPLIYHTISFYESEAAYAQGNALASVLVRDGVVFDYVTDDDYGSDVRPPALADNKRWEYSFDTSSALSNDGFAIMKDVRQGTYYTVKYFDSELDVALDMPSATISVRAGALLGSLTDKDFGSDARVPEAGDGYYWKYSVSTTQPLATDAYALRTFDETRYTISTEGNDPVFSIEVRVDGVAYVGGVDTVSQGKLILVSIAATTFNTDEYSLVKPVGFQVLAHNSSTVLYDFSDVAAGSFTMPACDVDIKVVYAMTLDVYTREGDQDNQFLRSVSIQELESLVKNTKPAYYTGWDKYPTQVVSKADKYVTLSDFLEYLGVDFGPGDSIELLAADGERRRGSDGGLTYENLYETKRYTYPNIASSDASERLVGKTEVEPALVLKGYQSRYMNMSGGKTIDDYTTDMLRTVRFVRGATDEEITNVEPSINCFLYSILSITVVHDSTDISGCTLDGFDEVVSLAEGGATQSQLRVLLPEGGELTEGKDYTLTYENNATTGEATLMVSGCGGYSGTITKNFRVVEAQEIAGDTRYSTSASVALATAREAGGVEGVIIASGANFPDALSASGLSGVMGYPVLLTEPNELLSCSADALGDLRNGNPNFEVLVLGGTSAVSDDVFADLQAYGGKNTVRISGDDRILTARAIYEYGCEHGKYAWSDTFVVARADSFPDALSLSAWAAGARCPLFLVSAGEDIPEWLSGLVQSGKFERALIAGGTSAVSAQAENTLSASLGASGVVRFAGNDRYDTSAQFARWEIEQGASLSGVCIATGENFPDGLSASALAATRSSVVLLCSDDTSLMRPAHLLLDDYKTYTMRVSFMGGTSAVPESVRTMVFKTLDWPSDIAVRCP